MYTFTKNQFETPKSSVGRKENSALSGPCSCAEKFLLSYYCPPAGLTLMPLFDSFAQPLYPPLSHDYGSLFLPDTNYTSVINENTH